MLSMDIIFGWLCKSTVQVSILILLVMAVKLIVRNRLSARWQYWLWLVVLVRMVLPWVPESKVSVFNLLPDGAVVESQEVMSEEEYSPVVIADAATPAVAEPVETIANTPVTPAKVVEAEIAELASAEINPPTALPKFDWPKLAWFVWLSGAAVLAAQVLVSNFRFWWRVKGLRPVTDQGVLDLLEDCKGQMKIETMVGVVITDAVKSPALFGFIRPRILLPAGMLDKMSVEQLRHVFLHELAHLKRFDIYVNWITAVAQVAYWFNPLVWFAFYQMRADREMACDSLALTMMGQDKPSDYGRTIVSLLEHYSQKQYIPAMAGILEDKSQLKRRITMIAGFKKNSYKWSPLAIALIIFLGCIGIGDAKQGKSKVQMPYNKQLSSIENISLRRIKTTGHTTSLYSGNGKLNYTGGTLQDILAKADEGHPIIELVKLPKGYYKIHAVADNDQQLAKDIYTAFSAAFDLSVSVRPIETDVYVITCQYPEALTISRSNETQAHGFYKHTETGKGSFTTNFVDTIDSIAWFAGYDTRKTTDKNGGHTLRHIAFVNESGLDGLYEGTIDWDLQDANVIMNSIRSMGFTITKDKRTIEAVVISDATADLYSKTLDNGITVELIGTCEHPGKRDKKDAYKDTLWWRPDGSPLGYQLYDHTGGWVMVNKDERGYEFAAKITNAPDGTTTRMKVAKAGSSVGGGSSSPEKDGIYLNDLRYIGTVIDKELSSTDVSVGIAAGAWETVASSGKSDNGTWRHSGHGRAEGSIVFAKPFEKDGRADITVTHEMTDRNVRLVAVHVGGKETTPVMSSKSGGGSFVQLTATYDISLDNIKTFRLQKREFEWVEFKGVSLRPDDDQGSAKEDGSGSKPQSKEDKPLAAWQTIWASYKVNPDIATQGSTDITNYGTISFGNAYQKDDSAFVEVTDTIDRNIYDVRIVAIGKDESTHLQNGGSSSGFENIKQATVCFDIPLKDIKVFHVQIRPAKDTLLHPNSKTELQAEVEKATANNSVGNLKSYEYLTFTKGMTIREALQFLGKKHKKNIIPSDKVDGQVPVTELYNVTFEEVLQAILGTHKYIIDGDFVRIYTAEEFAEIKNASLKKALAILKNIEDSYAAALGAFANEDTGSALIIIKTVLPHLHELEKTCKAAKTETSILTFTTQYKQVVELIKQGENKKARSMFEVLGDLGRNLEETIQKELKSGKTSTETKLPANTVNTSPRPDKKTKMEIQTKAIKTDISLLDWKPYERQPISSAIEKGQPVLIRFSADWCTNCKVIEKKVYSDKAVVDLIKAKDVLPMMADVTTQVSPASKDLNDVYGEKSVPLTIYIAPDGTLHKLRGLFENTELIKLLTKLPDVKPTVEVDGSGNILSDEVMDINKVLGEWFDNCSTGNVEGINKAWIPNNPKAGQDLKAMKKLMELNPGWEFSLLSIMWDKTEAMAVSGALQQGDLQVDGPMIFVWSLEKTDQGWKLTDIDLEELEGLQVENSRFMQRHPDTNVWFDNPDWKSPKTKQ